MYGWTLCFPGEADTSCVPETMFPSPLLPPQIRFGFYNRCPGKKLARAQQKLYWKLHVPNPKSFAWGFQLPSQRVSSTLQTRSQHANWPNCPCIMQVAAEAGTINLRCQSYGPFRGSRHLRNAQQRFAVEFGVWQRPWHATRVLAVLPSEDCHWLQ